MSEQNNTSNDASNDELNPAQKLIRAAALDPVAYGLTVEEGKEMAAKLAEFDAKRARNRYAHVLNPPAASDPAAGDQANAYGHNLKGGK